MKRLRLTAVKAIHFLGLLPSKHRPFQLILSIYTRFDRGQTSHSERAVAHQRFQVSVIPGVPDVEVPQSAGGVPCHSLALLVQVLLGGYLQGGDRLRELARGPVLALQGYSCSQEVRQSAARRRENSC